MDVLQRQRVQVTVPPAFAGDGQFAVPRAVAPLGVLVTQAFHAVHQQRLQGDFQALPRTILHGDNRRRRQAGAGNHDQPMLHRPLPYPATGVLGAGNILHGVVARQKALVAVPLVALGVLEPARQAALILPVQGQPVEMNRLVVRQRRAAAVGGAHRANTPGAVLDADGAAAIDLQLPAVVANPALPATELVQPGGIHHQMALVAQGLAPLFDTGGAGSKQQVALDAGIVGDDHHPVAPHGLQDVQRERAYLGLRGLLRRPPRAVKGILVAVHRQAEAAVQDAEIGIAAQGDAEIETAVPGVAVVPVAIVGAAVTGRGVSQGLGGLVNRIIVKSG